MKKGTLLAAAVLITMVLLLCGCGKQAPAIEETDTVTPEPTTEAVEKADATFETEDENSAESETEETSAEVAEESTEDADDADAPNEEGVSAEEAERTVEITIPAEYAVAHYKIGDTTVHEDGSVTYFLTEEEHDQLLKEVHSDIQSELDDMCESPFFLDFYSMTANEDCTVFTVVCLSIETSQAEQHSPRQLYEMARRYAAYQGRELGSIRIDYMNKIGNTFVSRKSDWDRMARFYR